MPFLPRFILLPLLSLSLSLSISLSHRAPFNSFECVVLFEKYFRAFYVCLVRRMHEKNVCKWKCRLCCCFFFYFFLFLDSFLSPSSFCIRIVLAQLFFSISVFCAISCVCLLDSSVDSLLFFFFPPRLHLIQFHKKKTKDTLLAFIRIS